MNEDFELIRAFKKGNSKAFEELVHKYKDRVFNTIYSITGMPDQADDITQEVFIKVYYSLGSFKYKSSFSTWLYRITVNKCLDTLRKNQKRTKIISLESELSLKESMKLKDVLDIKEENLEDKMIRKELQNTIQKILNAIPEKYRVIFTLKEIEHLSYDEISKVMNISIDKVKVWLFRARQKLKEKLEPVYRIYEIGGNE